MGLKAELTVKLDASTLIDQLLAEVGGPAGRLRSLFVPVDGAAVGEISGTVATLDLSTITTTTARLAEQLAPSIGVAPVAAQLLGPLESSLVVAEVATVEDIPAKLRALVERVSAELRGGGDLGFFSAVVRAGDLLADAPEGQVLVKLLTKLLEAAGARLPSGALQFPNVLPAIEGLGRALGGLMSLESVLAEAERLTGLMAMQVDAARVQASVDAVLACLGEGSQSVAASIATMDPNDAVQVQVISAKLSSCADRLEGVRLSIAESMGFGEATLVYLNVDQVQKELEAALRLLRTAQLDALERALKAVADRLRPMLPTDLSGLPSFSLDQLISTVEGEVAKLAATITNFDAAAMARPLAEPLGAIGGLLTRLAEAVEQVIATIRGALEQVRAAVAGLPLDEITGALTRALEPVRALIAGIEELVESVRLALESAVQEATQALTDVESAVDGAKAELDGFFGQAQQFVNELHLDRVAGEVADGINAFREVLDKARMQPYFETAADAIETTADVIGAVPFSLLPDAMKQEVDAAVKPIKDADARAIETEIETLLGVSEGKFELRAQLEAAIADVQSVYNSLMAALDEHNPRKHIVTIDAELVTVANKVREITPQLTLQPIQDAIQQVKSAVAGLDPAAALAPIEGAFDDALELVNEYSPDKLIKGAEERLDAAREKLVGAIKLREWEPALDKVLNEGLSFVNRFDPTALEPVIKSAIAEANVLLDQFPATRLSEPVGQLLALLLSGSGLRVYPFTFKTVLDWIDGASGSAHVNGRTARIAENITRTRTAVASLDPGAMAATIAQRTQGVRAAVLALPAGSAGRIELEAGLVRLDAQVTLAPLGAERARFLTSLEGSATLGETLQRSGMSEVDVTVTKLRTAFTPLAFLRDLLAAVAARIGLPGLENGVVPALRNLLAVAGPERIAGIAMPLFVAVRSRIETLLNAVILPIRTSIGELIRLVDALDLTPLRTAVGDIVAAVRAQIESLRPSKLLAAPLAQFESLRAEVAAFDPLGQLLDGLDALKEAVARIIGKLHAEFLLEIPLAIFDQIVNELRKLDAQALLAPVLNELDDIALEVDTGLDRTVEAFEKLQAALPSGEGSALELAVSVGVDIGF